VLGATVRKRTIWGRGTWEEDPGLVHRGHSNSMLKVAHRKRKVKKIENTGERKMEKILDSSTMVTAIPLLQVASGSPRQRMRKRGRRGRSWT